jgi:hypothetical protein
MCNLLLDEFDLSDWDALNPAQVELSPEQAQQAAQLSQAIINRDQRWKVYLSALGMFGFQQWLSERSPELSTTFERASIYQSGYPNLMAEVCQIQVGAFKVCLIPARYSHSVDVSIAVFDLPDFASHFYVLTQAIDDEERVSISGFLTYDQFCQNCEELQINSDWSYSLPLDWFNTDANALLLNLRCLEPSAIRLPALDITRSTVALREKLAAIGVQHQALWEVLTPEEGLTLLSDSVLVRSLYTAKPSINVGLWLRDQMDTIAQQFGWMLLPSLAPMRSLREDFDRIRSTLEQQGVDIPSAARGAYRTLRSDQGSFRLYAVTWLISEAVDQHEWVLLVALGAEPNEPLPNRLKLSIRDDSAVLFEQTLEESDRSVLYAQVVGNWDEKFRVTITASERNVFEIPPFGFELEETI